MNNLQRGFIIPLLLGIVTLLIVGSYAYVYMQKNQKNQPIVNIPTTQIKNNAAPGRLSYLVEILDWSYSNRPYVSDIYGPVNSNGYQNFCLVYADGRLGEAESALRTADGKPVYGSDGRLVGPINYLCNDSKEAWAATVPTPEKEYICIDSTGVYTIISAPLGSGQMSCGSTATKPLTATSNFSVYQKLENEWLTSKDAKKIAESVFYVDASSMGGEFLAKCDMWTLNDQIVAGIKDKYITIGSVKIISQNCGRGTSATFELEVLPQKGIIDCKAIVMEEGTKVFGCGTASVNRSDWNCQQSPKCSAIAP